MSEATLIGRCQTELSALIWSSVPDSQPTPTTNIERWQRFVGPALLLKAVTSIESMVLLMPERRTVDSFILLRALYESVVTLAWIAINPTYRLNRLYTEFHTWHLREHEDWAKAGRPILTLDEAAESRAWLDAHRTGLPHVADRAKNADRYWGARLTGWHPEASNMNDTWALSSLRGLYRFIYSRGSQATHSHHRGLDPFVTVDDSTCALHREESPDSLIVWDLGLRVMLFGIGPAESTLGWPSYEKARGIMGTESAPSN